jgi:hypothetical protein
MAYVQSLSGWNSGPINSLDTISIEETMNTGQSPAQRHSKQLVENCPLSLDIDRLMKLNILVPGFPTSKPIYWTDSAGQKVLSVWFEAQVVHPTLSWIELRFSITDPRSGERREVAQTIPIARTYPGFGRVRYWFVDEGRRVGKLYLPEGSDQFRSRHVHRLAYASQRLTRRERDARRRARIMRRLGADANSRVVPGKPSRMRLQTYRRLLSRLLHTRGPHDSRTFMSDLTILAGT